MSYREVPDASQKSVLVDSGQANYALAVLLIAYILSFIDRNVMAVLIGPIREEFAISDFQYSLLHGFAFSMFYIVLGLPIARLADRGDRRLIVAAGVFVWSLMTCLCGAARSFKALFIARIGVGIGEAALSPPAYSLLSDYFSDERLPRAMAIYTLGITLGGGLAYIIGGAVYEFFSTAGTPVLPLLGEVRPWQMTFFIVGAPGLLLVAFLARMVEPPRRGIEAAPDRGFSLGEVVTFVRQQWQAYTSLIMAVSLLAVLGYGTMAWYPEYLVRSHGMSRGEAGSWFGAVFIVAGSLGTLAGGFSAAPLLRRGYQDASMRLVLWIALAWMPPAVLGPLMSSSDLAVLLAVPIVFFLNSYFGLAIAALQAITPNQMRAQVSALLLFMSNLFGLALGPSIVAAITDFVFADEMRLGWSLALVPLVVCPLAAALVAWGLKYYRRALDARAGRRH
ncbi:MAG: MFS transporter [Pseudomonadota bacterium]